MAVDKSKPEVILQDGADGPAQTGNSDSPNKGTPHVFIAKLKYTENCYIIVNEFNEFEPCLKSAKNRFQLCAGLNLEILNTILSGTNHI